MTSIVKRRLISVGAVAVATFSAATACLWAVTPLFFHGPFMAFRHLLPSRLIEPSVPGHTDTLEFTLIAEARARLLLVCISWLFIIAVIIYMHVRVVRTLKT
jgi:hypothetical protein